MAHFGIQPELGKQVSRPPKFAGAYLATTIGKPADILDRGEESPAALFGPARGSRDEPNSKLGLGNT